MASRKYAGRTAAMGSDFIYIDLLPRVKRPRNFNVNLLLIVLFSVVVSWVLIYIPLSGRQETLDEVLAANKDLSHRLSLVSEEMVGYNIDTARVNLSGFIDLAEATSIDYFTYLEQFSAMVETAGGTVIITRYNNIENKISIEVSLSGGFAAQTAETLKFDFLDLVYVDSSTLIVKNQNHPQHFYWVEYMIEVNVDAE